MTGFASELAQRLSYTYKGWLFRIDPCSENSSYLVGAWHERGQSLSFFVDYRRMLPSAMEDLIRDEFERLLLQSVQPPTPP